MTRLLEIVADGSPGGGPTNVLSLLDDLSRLGGYELALAVQGGSYAFEQAKSLGVPAFGIDFARTRAPFAAARALRELIHSLEPDIVHVNGSRAGFFLACVPRGRHFPAVAYTVRGYHFLGKRAGARELAALADRFAHARADAIIHECRYDAALAARWHLLPRGARCEVIYNGIDRAELPRAANTDLRCVAFLGRLCFQKDPDLLAEIAAGLGRAGYRLRVIGSGELEGEFRARLRALGVESKVEMLGALPRAQALESLASAAALVLPSRWEGLPIAPIEAMAIGVPVVAANVSGLPEIVDSGVSGALIDERRPEPYVAAIRALCEDPTRRARTLAEAQRTVDSRFLRARNVEAHVALFESLLEEKRGPRHAAPSHPPS
jgi:glycosyltransferase involved in cell wall biosynthesis